MLSLKKATVFYQFALLFPLKPVKVSRFQLAIISGTKIWRNLLLINQQEFYHYLRVSIFEFSKKTGSLLVDSLN